MVCVCVCVCLVLYQNCNSDELPSVMHTPGNVLRFVSELQQRWTAAELPKFPELVYTHKPVFFPSDEDLRCSFTHLRTSIFKIFSNHGGGPRLVSGYTWGIFLQFIEEAFKCNFSHLRTSNFKIFSNHGGGQKLSVQPYMWNFPAVCRRRFKVQF